MAAPSIRRTTQLIEDIIPCALTLFMKYGYKKTTVDEIASGARISKKTLYEVFPSKEEILREAIWRETRKVIRDFEKTLSEGAGADEMMLSLCRVIFADRLRQGKDGALGGLYSNDTHIRQAARGSMIRIFSAIYEEGCRQGLFKPVTAGFAGEMIMNVLDTAEMLYAASRDPIGMINDTLSILADVIAYKNRLSYDMLI